MAVLINRNRKPQYGATLNRSHWLGKKMSLCAPLLGPGGPQRDLVSGVPLVPTCPVKYALNPVGTVIVRACPPVTAASVILLVVEESVVLLVSVNVPL